MRPLSITMISSALTMVDSRCAIIKVLRPSAMRSSSLWIARSARVSSAEVASSKIMIGGFFRKARAIAMRCFSPPESFRARSPTRVS